MPQALRYVYDDGDDLALLLARQPMGWSGLRNVPLMRQLSQRHTPIADAIIRARWDVPLTWLQRTLHERVTYLRSVIALRKSS